MKNISQELSFFSRQNVIINECTEQKSAVFFFGGFELEKIACLSFYYEYVTKKCLTISMLATEFGCSLPVLVSITEPVYTEKIFIRSLSAIAHKAAKHKEYVSIGGPNASLEQFAAIRFFCKIPIKVAKKLCRKLNWLRLHNPSFLRLPEGYCPSQSIKLCSSVLSNQLDQTSNDFVKSYKYILKVVSNHQIYDFSHLLECLSAIRFIQVRLLPYNEERGIIVLQRFINKVCHDQQYLICLIYALEAMSVLSRHENSKYKLMLSLDKVANNLCLFDLHSEEFQHLVLACRTFQSQHKFKSQAFERFIIDYSIPLSFIDT